jgi:hypothetical protein
MRFLFEKFLQPELPTVIIWLSCGGEGGFGDAPWRDDEFSTSTIVLYTFGVLLVFMLLLAIDDSVRIAGGRLKSGTLPSYLT